ncbi:hypothetical protein EMIT048CA2_30031 [Pseudomonas chlororaphis]
MTYATPSKLWLEFFNNVAPRDNVLDGMSEMKDQMLHRLFLKF